MKVFWAVVITLVVIVLLGTCCATTGALVYFTNVQKPVEQVTGTRRSGGSSSGTEG
jgi:hypothetical protein